MPSLVFFFILGIFLAIVGWGGVTYLIIYTLPYLGYRWLFFLFIMIGISGVTLPILSVFHKRFPGKPPVKMDTILREALLLGFYGDLLCWLQLGRVLTFPVSVYLLSGIVIVEVLIRVREKSHWSPQDPKQG